MHRIGRAGRYGRKGRAITLITDEEQSSLSEIEKYYGTEIMQMPKEPDSIWK